MKLENNMIVILPTYYKEKFISKQGLDYVLKVYTLNELKDKFLYTYKDDVLNYLLKKHNIIPEVGRLYLKELYYLDNTINNNKIDYLVNLKNELINNGYIIYNKLFNNYIKNKKILFYNCNLTKSEKKMISKLDASISYYNDKVVEKDIIDVYEYDFLEDEVIGIANKIINLINSGIDINKIYLNSVSDDYRPVFLKIFKFYNIPLNLNSNVKMIHLDSIKSFINNTPNDTLIVDLKNFMNDIDDKIENKLIRIINKYTSYTYYGDIKDILVYELNNSTVNISTKTNVIKEVNYKSFIPEDDEYIFMFGFNQDSIPVIYKDDKYLSTKEYNLLGLDNVFDNNNNEVNYLTNYINKAKNIFISYKLHSKTSDFAISNYLVDLGDKINKVSYKYEYNNDFINEIMLGSKLDDYVKYNSISNDLEDLLTYYNLIPYNKYDNKYKKIDSNIIKKQLNGNINLSFSSMDTFFKCPFRFLIANIYKLDTFKDSVSTIIGKLFHEVLCTVYRDKNDKYEEIIDNVVSKYYEEKEKTKKEEFYINKYKEALLFLINVLNEQLNNSSYEGSYFEKYFQIEKPGDLNVKIVGVIDKIMTFTHNDKTYVLVIDYKTGSMHNDFNKVIYGLDMQLLTYLYLIKNTNLISNPNFTGMYLQSIMQEVKSSEKGKTYKDIIKNTMKLNGYTINDVTDATKIDNKIEENSFISSMSIKKDGNFGTYAKVLNIDEINSLIDIVDKNINHVIDSIKQASFNIEPIKIDNDNEGCKFCKFKDICFMTNNDIKNVKKMKNLEFLEGDNDDTN